MYRVEALPHTADVGFEVTADSPEELYRGAADGLARALRAEGEASEPPRANLPRTTEPGEAGGDTAGAEPVERFTVERPDRERLMVSWLRELLHRITTRGRFPSAVSVELTASTRLRGEVRWEPDAAPEDFAREIKGVTYHGLAVERDEGGEWHARLVLDV